MEKFNNGAGTLVCDSCRKIICTGTKFTLESIQKGAIKYKGKHFCNTNCRFNLENNKNIKPDGSYGNLQ